MYSQTDEETYILNHFRAASNGTFLDIGAFNPFTFSNTRALYERGFKGVFVEPSPKAMASFITEYARDPDIELLPICIGAQSGMVEFFEAKGDAISTTVESETNRWVKEFGVKFDTIQVEMVDFKCMLSRCRYKKFDFINIDTEGNVLEILKQIDAKSLGCSLMCIEWNGKDRREFDAYFRKNGFKILMENAENLIYQKAGLWGL